MSAMRYSVFGLVVESELPLPELLPCDAAGEPDVRIALGSIDQPEALEPGLHQVPQGTVLVVEDVGRYLVSEGRAILVELVKGVHERNLRLFLLGSGFGLLLHQRGLLPLHANSISIGGKAVAFTGRSGAGKSTLAAWFHDRGHKIIADDVSAVGIGVGESPVVYPGLPRLRLWEHVLTATGREPAKFPLSFEGDEDYDKRDVLLSGANVAAEPEELGAIVLLTSAEPCFVRLSGAAAAEAVVANTYRGSYVQLIDRVQEHWTMCVDLVRKVPVFRAAVDFELDRLDQSYEPLLRQVEAAIAGFPERQ